MDYRPFGLLDITPGFPAGGVTGRTPVGADDLGRLLYSMTGAGGAQDAAGLLGGPSVRENLRAGNNFDAGLQMLAALPVVGMLGTAGRVAKAGSLTDRLASKFPQVDFALSEAGSGPMTLSKVVVPVELRGRGIGTEFMRDVLAHADEIGRPVALSPSSDFGGNKSKLTEWYKSLGFTPNKGRSKDFTTRETMIRQAAGSQNL